MKKLIIIGGGFAGIKLAQEVDASLFEVWMFDKNNYHQFQPLFYQVATSGLEPSSISFPLRKLFQNKNNFHIRNESVIEIIPAENKIITESNSYAFDYLVIATGCSTNFFGNVAIEQHAIPMKSVSEALYLRNFILSNFEKALNVPIAERKNYLNVVIVGGGPTGVEVSGALAEMRKYILPKDYPELDFSKMNIYLVEASAKTLGAMSEISSQSSKKYLEKLGVNVLLSTQVTNYDGNKVTFGDGNEIETKTLVWAAGIKGNVINGLDTSLITRGNRIKVNRYSQLENSSTIFAIGDISCMSTNLYPNGHPQVATVANEQGKLLGKNLNSLVRGKKIKEYEYSNKGSMATVGRHLAVVDLPKFSFQGFFAWIFWMFLHLMLILGVKNKFIVFTNWMWKYFTFDQSLRLIIKPYNKSLK
jgi:NADH dehydrogenase